MTLCAALAFSICAASAQSIVTKTIDTENLCGIAAHSGFDVILKQGPTSNAVISVDSRLQPYLHATVNAGVLNISFDNIPVAIQRKNLSRKAEISVNTLEVLRAHSGANVHGTGPFTIDGCEVDVHSGAHINLINLTANYLEVSVHSGASIILTGSADKLEATAASGATADLKGLCAKEVQAQSSSGSMISCWATDFIEGRASSGASVIYKGTPTHVDGSSSSGGSFRPMR